MTWPLVVFLHGSGERGNDPAKLCNCPVFQRKLPAIVIAPQCLPSRGWDPEAIVNLIREMQSDYHVNRRRIYLIGNSMGGYGTWQTAAKYPEIFAAIVPICGGGETAQASALARLPIWAFHGERDKTVPLNESVRLVEAIRRSGGTPQLSILPGAGHGIRTAVCGRDDLWKWLLSQERSD